MGASWSPECDRGSDAVESEWHCCEEMQFRVQEMEANIELRLLRSELEQGRIQSAQELQASKQLLEIANERSLEEERLASVRAHLHVHRQAWERAPTPRTPLSPSFSERSQRMERVERGKHEDADCGGVIRVGSKMRNEDE